MPSSVSVSRPCSLWTITRENRPRSFFHSSRFVAVRRGRRSWAVKTEGRCMRRTRLSISGAASHWWWTIWPGRERMRISPIECSAALNGSRARERPNIRFATG